MFSAGEILHATDPSRDGRSITASEIDGQVSEPAAADLDGTQIEIGGQLFTYDAATDQDWQAFLARIQREMAEGATAPSPKDAATELQSLDGRMNSTYEQIRQLQDELQSLPPEGEGDEATEQARQRIQSELETLRARLNQQIQRAEFLNRAARSSDRINVRSEYYEAAGREEPEGSRGRNTAAMTTGRGANQTRAQTARNAGGGTSFAAPSGWGAQTAMPNFSSDAFMQSMAMEDNILASYDSVLQSTSRGRQLMMMFFHFAKMAESGDMGAMYQFMKFITYIISKDKAKQQIDIGKKLIELQDTSRKYTDMLMNQQTDANDPNSSNEFMKTMTYVKSEPDSIATSQKLLSNMLEEMAMVVENLTGVTKGALDSYGRILRQVARMS